MAQDDNVEAARIFNRKAYELITDGLLDEAEIMVQASIQADPTNILSFNLLAGIYYNHGYYADAHRVMFHIASELASSEDDEILPVLVRNVKLVNQALDI